MSLYRLRIIIDGSYLFSVFKPYRTEGYHYSVKRMVRRLSEDYNLLGVHYFGSWNSFDENLRKKQEGYYYGILRDKHGYEVKILPLQWIDGILKEKGMDVALGVRLKELSNANAFDTAILVAADGDFSDTVKEVKASGRKVINAYFSIRRSYDLQQACGSWIRLDSIDMVYPKGDPSQLISLSSISSSI